ncbi:DnaJ domain [Dillenia turbinata]|uniref:DnaJ domain n=1 Tax=Dillenia turbinata TaxID=194707 RepID=A0AAN8UF76_9MAGN
MAASSTTAASPYILFSQSRPKNECQISKRISFRRRRRGRLIGRSSSGEGEGEGEASTSSSVVVEDESAVEAQKRPPSLISALNVEKALRGIAITDVDYYSLLGLDRGCTYDQVAVAYKSKVEEVIKQEGMDQEQVSKQLDLLKEAYSILSSVEERRMYDWSLARSEQPTRYTWPSESDISQKMMSAGDPPPPEPEDVGPTRLVGYFMLGWLILSVILSIGLNR